MFSGSRKMFSKIRELLNIMEESNLSFQSTTTLVADWSMLPCDILGEIALKLDSIDDFIHFSAVCHSWKNASSMLKPKQNAMPWLLLAQNPKRNPNRLRKIYNLSNNKCYQLSMPETFGARCWGSSCGWLVILTYDFQVQLFNPLTKERITTLPSVQDLPLSEIDYPNFMFYQYWRYKYWRKYLIRFVVLQMPQSNDLLAAVFYGGGYKLSIARPGDQAWTFLIRDSVEDLVCCGDFIYVVCAFGHVLRVDMMGICDLKDAKVTEYVPRFKSEADANDKVYILNLGGDLLMVTREKYGSESDSSTYYGTRKFGVFRLDSKSRRWVEIEDFGNFSILVGSNYSISIPVSSTSNLKCNSIYFTDDEHMYWDAASGLGGHDTGIYDMKTGSITPFYQGEGDTRSALCPPIFFVPSF